MHDTAQVMGAALTYKTVFHDDVVFTVAAVTKLTRNVFLAAAIPYLAWRSEGGGGGDGVGGRAVQRGALLRTALPPFVLCFLGMAALRTTGDSMLASGSASLLLWDPVQWKAVCSLVTTFSTTSRHPWVAFEKKFTTRQFGYTPQFLISLI